MSKCSRCNTSMKKQQIIYENPKWGEPTTNVKEQTKANVCPKCGEISFSLEEAHKLIHLSKTY